MSDPQEAIKRWLALKLEAHGEATKLAKFMRVADTAVTRMKNLDPSDAKARRQIKPHEIQQLAEYFNELPPGYEGMTTWIKPDRQIVYSKDDPAAPDPIDPDRQITIGEYTSANIPADASPQIDVRAGMGAGGVTIVAQGVPGKGGLTFAAEVVADYWRMPVEILVSLGVSRRPQNLIILPVQGTSMLPVLTEGDYVFVDTRHRIPSPDGIYAIVDEFDSIVVKTLRSADRLADEDDEPRVEIVSKNPEFPIKRRRASEVNVVGRVVRRFTADFGRED